MLTELIDILRVKGWFQKVQLNIIAGILFMLAIPVSRSMEKAFIVFLLFQGFLLSYGHILNSWCDRKQDKEAKKNTGLANFSEKNIKITLFVLGTGTLAISFYIGGNSMFFGIAGFLLATFYSAQPLRLKERGLIGPVASALTQTALPFLLFAAAVELSYAALLFAVWLFLRQLLGELYHQIDDFENDKKTGVKSMAVLFGKKQVGMLMVVFFALAIIFTIAPVFLLTKGIIISLVLAVLSFGEWSTISNLALSINQARNN